MKCWSREFEEKLKEAGSAYIFVHTSPDGDCVASAVAVAYAMMKAGRRAVIFTDDFRRFRMIYGKMAAAVSEEERVRLVDVADGLPQDGEGGIFVSEVIRDFGLPGKPVILFADCRPARAGKFVEQLPYTAISDFCTSENTLVIDHHPAEGEESTLFWIDDSVTSASEMCARVVREILGAVLDRFLSAALFYGIASDTGFFKFAESSETFAICSELVATGIRPDAVYASMHYGRRYGYNRYLAHLVANLRYCREKRIALAVDDYDKLAEFGGLSARPTDDLFEIALNTKDVDVFIFIKFGYDDEYIDCSVRVGAFSDFDAAAFCAKFGGGGHRKAASFHVKGEIEDVTRQVIEAAGFVEDSGDGKSGRDRR